MTTILVGERGRVMIPAAVRRRAGLSAGTVLCLLETPGGLVLMKRDQLRDHVRAELAGLDLVSELLAQRRLAADAEDTTSG